MSLALLLSLGRTGREKNKLLRAYQRAGGDAAFRGDLDGDYKDDASDLCTTLANLAHAAGIEASRRGMPDGDNCPRTFIDWCCVQQGREPFFYPLEENHEVHEAR